MKFSFNPNQGLILVQAMLEGPNHTLALRMALDTGASGTFVNLPVLLAVGYNPLQAQGHVQINTAGGVSNAPRLTVAALSALGYRKQNVVVCAHNLPLGSQLDGLLGLDFLRGKVLTIDFPAGEIELV